MDLYNIFTKFFGLPGNRYHGDFGGGFDDYEHSPYDPVGLENDDDEDDDADFMRSEPSSPFGFRIFSEPLEMHRFFEHQMDEMMRRFSMFDGPSAFGSGGFPALDIPGSLPEPEEKRDLRDKVLKPHDGQWGSIWNPPSNSAEDKVDKDLDDKISAGDLSKLLQENTSRELAPHTNIQSYGRSVVVKTVRRPDGLVEHHRTVRDNQGNEETTVTRKIGDQTHSVTSRTNSSGIKEQVEDFVNIDEGKLSEFEKKWSEQQNYPSSDLRSQMSPNPESHQKDWAIFKRLFKID